MAKELVGPRPGNPGIDEGDEAWIARNNYDFKLTREAGVAWVEEKKGRVTRTFRCNGLFRGKRCTGCRYFRNTTFGCQCDLAFLR